MSNYRKESIRVFCWELKKWFESQKEAGDFLIREKGYSSSATGEINKVLNKLDRTVAGYHWCSDKSQFKDKKLIYKKERGVEKTIYCYETKEEFKSSKKASEVTSIQKQNIKDALDNPLITAGGYHWCTDLSIFDGIDFNNIDSIYTEIYCYETQEKFVTDNTSTALEKIMQRYKDEYPMSQIYNLKKVINKSGRTYFNYHWCTDLDSFKILESNEDRSSIYRKKVRVDNFIDKEFITREIVPEGVDYLSQYKFPVIVSNEVHDYLLKKEFIDKLNNPDCSYYYKLRVEYDLDSCPNGCTNREISFDCRQHNMTPPEIKYKIFHSICPLTKNILDDILSSGGIPELDLELEWDDLTNSYSTITKVFTNEDGGIVRLLDAVSETDELEKIFQEEETYE